jgi:hypothetical protein
MLVPAVHNEASSSKRHNFYVKSQADGVVYAVICMLIKQVNVWWVS